MPDKVQHAEAGDRDTEPLAGLECAVCFELLCEPVTLTCEHAFCRSCIASALRAQRRCPLCRTDVPEGFDAELAPVNRPLEQLLIRRCTVEYAQRLEDVAAAAARLVRLRIGNVSEISAFVPKVVFRWTVSVDLESSEEAGVTLASAQLPDLVDRVRFGLVPACRLLSYGSMPVDEETRQKPATHVEVQRAPFEVTATSWTAFTVPIVIIWKDWLALPPLRLEHSLDFQRGGGNWSHGVDLGSVLHARSVDPAPVVLQERPRPSEQPVPDAHPRVQRQRNLSMWGRLKNAGRSMTPSALRRRRQSTRSQ